MPCPSYDGLVASVKDGRIIGMEGDKEHPWSKGYACPKGRNEWKVLYHPDRFTRPLLKMASGRKEISWEKATEMAADRLGEIIEGYGAKAIATTLPLLAMGLFTRTLGSPNEMTNQDLCQGASETADPLTYGEVLTIYRSSQDFSNSKCVLMVGTNMPNSCGGQWQQVLHAKKNGAKLIVVDPRRSKAARDADIYLQIRPGTDGALALAMLNVIINEKLYDIDFVEKYCHGFDKLKDHVQQYTPEWASEVTWLSQEEIVETARVYATNGPASYRGNIGLCQHSNSTQAARAFAALIALGGNIDVQGGNRMMDYPPFGFDTYQALLAAAVSPEVERQTMGAERFPLWAGPESVMHRPHNPSIINAMLTGEPYPVKSWIIQGANPVLTYASSEKVIEAIKRLEFSMTLAYTPSPTSDLVDLILPVAHPFEQKGLRFGPQGNFVTAAPKIVDPPEGCREDLTIFYDICEAMVKKGYIEKNMIPWRTYDGQMEAEFAGSDMTYRDFCETGTVIDAPQLRKYEERGFFTPSGKVELYSERMENHGYAPLPTYLECEESPLLMPHLAEKYPLYLTTRREQKYYLSRSADYEWVRESMPYPELHIHPDAAAERGIADGDMLAIETPKSTVKHVAKITEDIHPEVVNGIFGFWLPEKETAENGYLETNVNATMSYDPPYDPEIGINRIQGVMCQVHKL